MRLEQWHVVPWVYDHGVPLPVSRYSPATQVSCGFAAISTPQWRLWQALIWSWLLCRLSKIFLQDALHIKQSLQSNAASLLLTIASQGRACAHLDPCIKYRYLIQGINHIYVFNTTREIAHHSLYSVQFQGRAYRCIFRRRFSWCRCRLPSLQCRLDRVSFWCSCQAGILSACSSWTSSVYLPSGRAIYDEILRCQMEQLLHASHGI